MTDDQVEHLQPGQWAAVRVQYLEERNGRALVRLPNGSKSSVGHGDLHPMLVEYSPRDDVPNEEIGPGDIYEDCNFHPVLCVSRDGDEVQGISLIDGSRPRACSLSHCGVVKLDIASVVRAVDPVGAEREPSDE